jgi:cytosine/adenosine deaminase-related metal-dependent hydrolase
MRAYRPAWLWTGEELVRAPVVTVDDDGRIGLDPRGLPVEDLDGVVLPGLINAHVHLELPALPALAAPSEPRLDPGAGGFPPPATPPGFVAWLGRLRGGPGPSAAVANANASAAVAYGTAAVGDIGNSGLAEAPARAAGLAGRFWNEVFGIDVTAPPDLPMLTPHAPYSTHPAVIRAAAAQAAAEDRTWSFHFDEDSEEAAFLLRGEGAWPPILRALKRNLDVFPIPGLSPAAWLASLRVLDARALLVHAVCTRGADLDIVAASGARVCLCVRSNLHIGGRLPDVQGMLDRRIPLAIGTDSRASSPDLDPLAEAAACMAAFPEVAPEVWLRALTVGGAEALAMPALGRIAEGAAPGLLHVELSDPESGGRCGGAGPPRPQSVARTLLGAPPRLRRWLSRPGAPG